MKATQHATARCGFSLVELAIVLVILGLIAGGIMAGQSLIRASELRAVGAEYQRYVGAVRIFQEKFFGLPGDMKNATAYWGAADGNDGLGTDCFNVKSTTTVTCNGNGDRVLQPANTAVSYENYRFWQHLGNAGMIEGSYTGAAGQTPVFSSPSYRYAVIGENIPGSKMPRGGWYAHYINAASSVSPSINLAQLFIFGATQTNDITETPLLSASEAWNIDTKLDDGKPGYGNVQSYFTRTECVSSLVDSNATYVLSDSSKSCTMLFIIN